MQLWRVMVLLGVIFFLPDFAFAEGGMYSHFPENHTDSLSSSDSLSRRFIHRFGIEARPDYVLPTSLYMREEGEAWAPVRISSSVHLKYSFQSQPNTYIDRIYRSAYQGAGLAYYTFGNREQLGNPVALYLFQGARLNSFTPWLSLNYEWNFGLSSGWKPYDHDVNPYNKIIGSKVNAYINANFYLRWMLSRQFDLTSGITFTHFSNGNTGIPNAGLNTAGLNVGLVYNFNRKDNLHPKPLYQPVIPKFPRHVSYDLVLFGSWRRKEIHFESGPEISPETYRVMGVSFAPMYNFSYKFRAGVSVDGVYDGSANIYMDDYYLAGTAPRFYKPSLDKQLALGLSGRAEYVMPYFTINLGLGVNILHGGGDLKALYQVLALKTEITRNTFVHVGYSLHNFHSPNFLMLGIGFRFNNQYPTFLR